MRILDRYLIRELLLPITLSLVVLTFMMVIPTILRDAEDLIAKGVAWGTVLRVIVLLLPSALSLTIPMALLLGILIGFGRLSADREFVAMQACGLSLSSFARPVALLALLATAADAYEIIVALPDANQTYREIAFNEVANRAEGNMKPRVFFDMFPNRVIYARDVIPGGWRDVFMADTSRPGETTVYFAKEGRLLVNRQDRTVTLELKEGTRHTTSSQKPAEYEGGAYDTVVLQMDPTAIFRQSAPAKTVTEMSIPELKASIAAGVKLGDPGNSQRFMIQQKFAIPVASLVLALIGLTIGVSNRKDGRLASFARGFAVIFLYYVVYYTSRAAAITGQLQPSFAPWIPNIIFGVIGIVLFVWRTTSSDRPLRLSIPTFWRRQEKGPSEPDGSPAKPQVSRRPRVDRIVVVIRVPQLGLPRPRLLDWYVSRQYLGIFILGVVALLGIFYISTFMDLADKLFRGSATTAMLLRFFFFQTPQYVYYIIPMAVLVSALVTIGLMTKNSELIVMRACGISLYRTALPLMIFAAMASVALFALQEQVMAVSNREADRLNRVIRGLPPISFGALDRRWMVGENGDIYHYDFFDGRKNEFTQLSVYRPGESPWALQSVLHATRVVLAPQGQDNDGATVPWTAYAGWTREFRPSARNRTVVDYSPFADHTVNLETPTYFKSDEPDAALMTYGQLKDYISRLETGGFNTTPYLVSLQRKVAFPFVTLVMTLLAVPFAVTTGRRGALYGVGVGIVLAISYWLMLSVFAAVGSGGLLPPVLAAWAPNLLFGAAALYMVLTVRT